MTVFDDGACAVSRVVESQVNIRRAARLGYEGNVGRMIFHYHLVCNLLAERLGHDASPTLWYKAHNIVVDDIVAKEQLKQEWVLVRGLQKFTNGIENTAQERAEMRNHGIDPVSVRDAKLPTMLDIESDSN